MSNHTQTPKKTLRELTPTEIKNVAGGKNYTYSSSYKPNYPSYTVNTKPNKPYAVRG